MQLCKQSVLFRRSDLHNRMSYSRRVIKQDGMFNNVGL